MSSRRRKPPPDLAGLLPSWEVALAAERKSPKTIRVYGDGVRAFIRWCADTNTDPVLTRLTVQAFTVALLDGGAEAHTARARQQALRRFAAWLVAEGELDDDPLLGMKLPQLDTKVTSRWTLTNSNGSSRLVPVRRCGTAATRPSCG